MTQPPPHQDAYDAEARRQIDMTNYPPAPPSPPGYVGYPGAPPSTAQPAMAGYSPRQGLSTVVVVLVVVLASLAVIAGIIFMFVLGTRAGSPQSQVVATTSQAAVEVTDEATAEATQNATVAPTKTDATPDATADPAGPPFASRQDPAEMYDSYMEMKRRGKIYEIIPDTDEGRAYFTAFMYSIVDLKAAAIWGPLDAESLAELATREKHFLALEDLDLTVDITFEDGTSFTHDGHPPVAG